MDTGPVKSSSHTKENILPYEAKEVVRPKEEPPKRRQGKKKSQAASQSKDIEKCEESGHEGPERLKLVYYKPSSTKRSGIAFAMVHGSCNAGSVRRALQAAKKGGEAMKIQTMWKSKISKPRRNT